MLYLCVLMRVVVLGMLLVNVACRCVALLYDVLWCDGLLCVVCCVLCVVVGGVLFCVVVC